MPNADFIAVDSTINFIQLAMTSIYNERMAMRSELFRNVIIMMNSKRHQYEDDFNKEKSKGNIHQGVTLQTHTTLPNDCDTIIMKITLRHPSGMEKVLCIPINSSQDVEDYEKGMKGFIAKAKEWQS